MTDQVVDLGDAFARLPDPEDAAKLQEIRVRARGLAELIKETTPGCADQDAAIRNVCEAVIHARASFEVQTRRKKR